MKLLKYFLSYKAVIKGGGYMRKTVELSCKRSLSYIEVGDENGKVVFYFHGVPSAASEWKMWGSDEMLKEIGVRLIAVDRPGVGQSTFIANRTLSDWPKDVASFADILGIERFSVLGYSGGGPYAAACAAKLGSRLQCVGLVSSVCSFEDESLLDGVNEDNIKFLKLAIQKPILFRFIYWQMGLLMKHSPSEYLKRTVKTFDKADRETFSNQNVYKAIFSTTGSPNGQQFDTKLIFSKWDFDLADIEIPVLIWHGGKDRNASPAVLRYFENTIKNNTIYYYPEEGHISLIVNHAKAILKKLTE